MKLKADHKAFLIVLGFIFAWFAVYIMAATFYEGVTQAVARQPYQLEFLRRERLFFWMVCIAVSSVCLAIGLRGEHI